MKKVIRVFLICVFFILLIGGFSKVFGAEDFNIKIVPNNRELTTSDVMLIIEISSNKVFDNLSTQAVQVLIGEESSDNTWKDLGTGKNSIALRKSYNCNIKNNAKVSVRIVSWNLEDRSDLKQLAIQTYEVSNIDKTNPIIEKLDVISATKDSISINIVAKDLESGISKYTCSCDSISYKQVSENSKFDITGLEENKEYDINIVVEDKIGNKTSLVQKVKTLGSAVTEVPTESTVVQPVQNEVVNNTDSTIANKIIPEVGKKDFIFVIVLISTISFIIIKNKR